ncbi:acetyl-CoA carboxylase biotin carboxyl carrier protein subunit [Pontibacillus litoralis]|uniref:Acetyl-CoA carboxylase n=1 Tax=Pontibacillus litoralis JSM 072002 TaxID=1385512 RepID=A0A0A5HV98_9BACI|nr:acetyl-CoA carboxylase biotin carboxyl carrier protein subunit [Pontibacillus litoralis]KGX87532.1 acetyl-CoA carboxylase [Pontibacillus litoralis JSM 072002]
MIEVKANMAGSVWKIVVAQGDEVTDGQDLVILESMKMEIPIQTDEDGTVVDIKVQEGDFVNEGDVLATIKES